MALFVLGSARPAAAGDPDRVWKTIESEHFVVHYYEPLDEVAHRVAVVAERAHRVLAPILEHEPSEKTQVVLVDDTDGANGFANVIPRNRIWLHATAPTGISTLNDHDDWLFGLVAHEYTHILHLDSIAGLPAIYNQVFGKTWAPNQVQPRWVIEGLATYEESARTSGGRTRNAQFGAYLRMSVVSDRVLNLDQVSTGPQAWPHGTAAYLYGSHFLKYIFDRYGDDEVAEISWGYANQPIPYGLNRAAERAVGKPFTVLFQEWKTQLRAQAAMEVEAVLRRGKRAGRRLTFSGEAHIHPCYSASGNQLVWRASDGESLARFRAMPVGENVGKAEDYAIIHRAGGFDLLADGSMVVEQATIYRSSYSYQDLYLWDRSSDRLIRLTHGARARDPAVSPDQRYVAFSQNGNSSYELAVMPLSPGAEPEVLWSGGPFEQAYSPAWSPDGKSIAISVWRGGGARDIVLVDVATKETTAITDDRALDLHPVFSPDGRFIYYSSDRTGIYNIYAYDRVADTTWQVTNVLGYALMPAVSPDGARIAYTGIADNGTDLFEIEVDRDRWLVPEPYINDRPTAKMIRDDAATVSEPRPYRPLATLAPNAYKLTYQIDPNGSFIGVSTGGSDVIGRHSYSLGAGIDFGSGDVNVGMSYWYNRLWPGLRLSMFRDTGRRGGVYIDGERTAYTEEVIGLSASASIPALTTADGNARLSLSYDLDWLRNTEDELDLPDPNDQVPGFPETDVVVAGVGLSWVYSDLRGYTYTLGPQEGKVISVGVGLDHPGLGSDFYALTLSYRWDGYIRIPWIHGSSLAIQTSGGIRTTDRDRSGVYVIGGVPDQDIIQSIQQNRRYGASGYLRGYPGRVATGHQYHLANIELRQEILDIEEGIATLPIYVRRLHVAALVDAGDAFDGPITEAEPKVAVGGALRLNVVLGYFAPAALDIGVARGLTSGGITEYWMLLTGSL